MDSVLLVGIVGTVMTFLGMLSVRAVVVRKEKALTSIIRDEGRKAVAASPRESDSEPCVSMTRVIFLGDTQPKGMPSETVVVCSLPKAHGGSLQARHRSMLHGSQVYWSDAEEHIIIEPMDEATKARLEDIL